MAKNFQNIALVALIFVATSCGVSKNFTETRVGSRPKVCLLDNNFRIIKTVKGQAEVTSFLGIGKEKGKLALEDAIKSMYEAADLKGSQAIVDILPSMRIKEDYLFVRKWAIEVMGLVIEFTDERVQSSSSSQEIVLPVRPVQTAGKKEPTFEEIVSIKDTTLSTTPDETTTTIQVSDSDTTTTVVKTETTTEPIKETVESKTEVQEKTETPFEAEPTIETENLPSLSKMKREANRAIRRVNLDKIKTREDYEEAMLNLDIAEEYNIYLKDSNLAHQIKRMKQYLENRESTYN